MSSARSAATVQPPSAVRWQGGEKHWMQRDSIGLFLWRKQPAVQRRAAPACVLQPAGRGVWRRSAAWMRAAWMQGWLPRWMIGWAGAALVATAMPSTALAAAAWPAKPVTVVVPFAPGGYTDVVARLLADKMAPALGQPVLIDNRPGAGSTIGTNVVAKAAPDGYTLGLVSMSQVMGPWLYKRLPYDALKDFTPIARLVAAPSVLVVNPALPVKTVEELIALAKARPDTLGYASSGNGSTQHLVGSMFAAMTGVRLTHIPYKGSNQSLVDVIGGQVAISFVGVSNALPHVKAGRLRALAVTTAARCAELPDVPTLQEAGLKDFDVAGWLGLVAPAHTPPEIVQRLHAEAAKALSTPEARRALAAAGVSLSLSNSEDFARLLDAEYARWGKVISAAGVKVE